MRRSFIIAAGIAAWSDPLTAQATGEPQLARSAAPDVKVELSSGFEYKAGEYGTGQHIETISIPTAFRVSTGRLQLSASLPYVRVDAPGTVVGGGGLLGLPIVIDPTRPPGRETPEGVGDLRLGAAYTLPTSSVGLTLSSEVKIPTASEAKGLGTGKPDYVIGAELSKRLGTVTPFLGIGYTLPGDPEGYELRNSLSARVGAAVQMSPTVRGHIDYGYAQSISPLVTDEQQVAAGLNASLSRQLSLGLHGTAGLSEGAPDVGIGLQLGMTIR